MITWNRAFRLMTGLLFFYGAWLRWTDGFVAITTPDSFEYLQGALTGDLSQVAWRSFPYPLFLKLCIEHLGGFGAVLVLQKLFGLTAAALTFAAWMKVKATIRYTQWGGRLHDSFGLLLLAMMLLSYGSTRYFEQSIMLESASTLALAALVFGASGLFVAFRRSPSVQVVAIWVGLTIGISLFANALNPRFSPAVFLAFSFAAISLHRVGAGLWQSLAAILVPVLLAVPLLILPQRPLDQRNIWNRTFVPMHFLFMHARLVLPEIERDRDDPMFTRYDRSFLKEFSGAIEDEFSRAAHDGPGGNYTLLYDPNRLLWGRAGELLRSYARDSASRYNEFCGYYFKRALWHNPLGYAQKVMYEWVYLLRPSGPVLDDSWEDLPLAAGLAWGAGNSGIFVERSRPSIRPVFAAYQAQLADKSGYSGVVFRTPFSLNHLGLWVNRGFSLLWLVVLGFAGFCLWRKRADPGLTILCLVFLGSSIFLFAQLAPLAFVTTTCGARAIQGLRVLLAFVTVDLGLMSFFLLTTLMGRRHWLLCPFTEPGDGKSFQPPA